ncbi:MAG: hypothetical protein JO180_03785 [Gemmatirosa sp.]|nr:hypothetical protein [Gemmatirosa sp.]
MGSAVDSAGISAQLRELAAAGFGGVEVTAIYGVKGAEAQSVPYLSDRWVALLGHTAAEAHRLGMAVDVPPGSGWRMGGPNVQDADVNASLQVTVDTVRGGATWAKDLSTRRVGAVMAVSDAGQTIEIARGQPDGTLRWTAPAGSWTVYVAGTKWSGDNVKRPAPGGEGRSIDVFSQAASERYFAAFGSRLASLPRGAMRAYFHDSFEYTGDFSPALLGTFEERRGYDLARDLPALTGHGDADRVARVKSDYRQTLDEMLLDHFSLPLTAWSHAHGSLSRLQAHGSPGNLLDLYAAADIPETEIFGVLGGQDADPLVEKFASSAAHVAGRRLASAESFTWLGEHFTGTLDDVKQAADQLFLVGINHLVYHGTAYSPANAAWPGWEFYASSEFNPRNATWHDLPAFNAYVTRVQSVLQAGRADGDVLLYWPVWDSWHDPAGFRMDFRVHNPPWLHAKPIGPIAETLWRRGWGFDYVSDRQLAADVAAAPNGRVQSGGATWGTIVVPRVEHVPPETMERLLALARGGATVLFVDALPADVPGLGQLAERHARLEAAKRRVALGTSDSAGVRRASVGRGRVLVGGNIEALLAAAGIERETMVDQGLRVMRRAGDGGRTYFLSHAGAEPVDGWVPLAASASSATIMDPMTGRTGLARVRTRGRTSEVYLQLAPGESMIVRTFARAVVGPAWSYRAAPGAPVALRGRWDVQFVDGGPALPPAFQSDTLGSWAGRGDADADRFAGTARYTLRFDAPDAAPDHLLELGRVGETARVRLNGRVLGTLVARPFHLATGPLRATGNVLEVEVTNLSANRIRDLDIRGVPWKIFHDINYVGIDYKPFDASKWPLRASGLLGPVTLTPLGAHVP